MDIDSTACDCTAQIQEAVANATWKWLWVTVGISLVAGVGFIVLIGAWFLFNCMVYRAYKQRVTRSVNSVRTDVADLTNYMRADLNQKEH